MNLTMALYTTVDYSTLALSEHVVRSDQNIYVGIEDQGNSTSLKFIVNDCFATPTPSPDDPIQYMFFKQKCALDTSYTDNTAGRKGVYFFKFQAFWFIAQKGSVYLHCRLYLCPTSNGESVCTQTCSSRKRRSVEDEVKEQFIMMSREIKFDNSATCDKSFTCPLNSACHSLDPAVCICNDGYVFNRKEERCTTKRLVTIKGMHLDYEWNDNYADKSSTAFYKLAVRKEDLIYRLLMANNADEDIEGVKVIGAREGSVILDVEIIYAETITPKDAFNTFVNSISTKTLRTTIVHRMLNIRSDMTPTLFIQEVTRNIDHTEHRPQNNNGMQTIILVVVIVALLLVIFTFGVAYKMKERRERRPVDDVNGYDNGGIEMNKKC